jgi:hypothetical protein
MLIIRPLIFQNDLIHHSFDFTIKEVYFTITKSTHIIIICFEITNYFFKRTKRDLSHILQD